MVLYAKLERKKTTHFQDEVNVYRKKHTKCFFVTINVHKQMPPVPGILKRVSAVTVFT